MPELPEIETISKYLQVAITDCKIDKVVVRKSSLRWPVDNKLATVLQDSIIVRIHRRAKYLLIDYHNKDTGNGHLIIHLGMSGRLSIVSKSTPINKHDHIDFILHNGKILRYCDPRRFGAVLWTNNNPLNHKLLANLGPEPFDPLFNAEYLLEKSKKTNLPIKQFIMNNKIVVGVGNIYANEALFAAKIHPLSVSKRLTLSHLKSLVTSIRKILQQAILQGGTTLKDFFGPSGSSGKFFNNLKVYGKSQQACLACNTIIKQIKLGQRSTFFCHKCQVIH